MTLFEKTDGKLEREHRDNLDDYNWVTGDEYTNKIVEYLDGNKTGPTIDLMVRRFCSQIKKTDDGYESHSIDVIEARQAAVKAGLFELLPLGILDGIAGRLAGLNGNCEYLYSRDGKPDDDFAANMSEERERGKYSLKLGRLDLLSTASGSSCMMVQESGGKLDYQPIQSNKIWICFGARIWQDGEERAVNNQLINEASAVVVLLSSADGNKSNYVAFFPRSEQYPNGKCVSYKSDKWSNIPEDAQQHTDNSGEYVNPLTALQKKSRNW